MSKKNRYGDMPLIFQEICLNCIYYRSLEEDLGICDKKILKSGPNYKKPDDGCKKFWRTGK